MTEPTIKKVPIPSDCTWPSLLDLSAVLASAPTAPQFVVGDIVPCGYATLLGGHGGAGKSSLALHLSACIAMGCPWFRHNCVMRRVLYLSCEDRTDILHWRLSRICDYEGVTADALANLKVLDLVGHDAVLYQHTPDGGKTTAAYAELLRRVEASHAEVIVIDGVADTFGGNENDRAQVKQFVNACLAAVGSTGALILLAHVNKNTASVGKSSEGYSGSTGWHNSVRSRLFLYPEYERSDDGPESTGKLILDHQKSNLGQVRPSLAFQWSDEHRLFVAEDAAYRDQAADDEAERQGILAALRSVIARGDYCPAASQGPRTAFHVLSAAEGFPESLKSKAKKRRFLRHIEKLRAMGEIVEGSITRADRHVIVTLMLKGLPDNAARNAGNSENDIPADSPQPALAGNAGITAGGYRGCARTHLDKNARDYLRATEGE